MVDFQKPFQFEWDKGNIDKSYQKHGITPREAEEIFLDEQILFLEDVSHSEKEERFIAIGKTVNRKRLFAIFTIRGIFIRIISVRAANKKERRQYEEVEKDSKI